MEINSQVVCEYEVGEIFDIDGKPYILLSRNPWTARIVRFYWFDKYIMKFTNWLYEKAEKRDAKRRA